MSENASIGVDETVPEAAWPRADAREATVEGVLTRLRARVEERSADWCEALVEAMAEWPLAEERVDGRRRVYLIGGEAFDWRALADRLLDVCCEGVGASELEEVLWGLGLPGGMGEEEFRRSVGVEKYRAHLNYVYGVTVEQTLQVAVQEEICKRHVGNGYMPGEAQCEGVYEGLYGRPLGELWAEFRAEVGEPEGLRDGTVSECVADGDAFTYWLFKRRVERSDPARVASDTKKGLSQLAKMRRSHERRLRYVRQGG
ncbi:MAG: hypothetical protein FJ313_04865 [Gemmatimonadetes bacterium]|nr:hypothetical protein [Gemmatimonadota bacterium]